MKNLLRKLFSPLLNLFESGTEEYSYEHSHRVILWVMGTLFLGLSIVVFLQLDDQGVGYLIPVVVFSLVGGLSLIIGLLGDNRAVAKIWGSSK